MTEDQINKVSWLKFSIYPPTPNDRTVRSADPILENLTYAELVAFWRDNLNGFETIGDTINRALGETESLDIDIDALLSEEMRNLYNVPNKPQSVKEAMMRLVAELPFSMGNSNEEPTMHAQNPPIVNPQPSASSARNERPNDTDQAERTRNGRQRLHRRKWNTWVKELRRPETTEVRRQQLNALVRSGYNAEWLGEPFYSSKAALFAELVDFDLEYLSANDEDIELP
jgi:hypothetical protein